MRCASMQLEQVRHFLLLCEEMSFTRAARRCGIAQPSLSKSIRALERELGGMLFHRRPAAALTARGRLVRPYLEQIAFASDLARRAAKEFIECRSNPTPETTSAEPRGGG